MFIDNLSTPHFCGFMNLIPYTLENSTPYVKEKGFPTLRNAVMCMFILWYKIHKAAEVRGREIVNEHL